MRAVSFPTKAGVGAEKTFDDEGRRRRLLFGKRLFS